MSYYLTIGANFRTGTALPSIEDHYEDLWRFALALDKADFPTEEWYPPARSIEDSLLNPAFGEDGPTSAALAMAHSDKANRASDVRTLGVWNGNEGRGGAAFTTTYTATPVPGYLSFNAEDCPSLLDYNNVKTIVTAIIDIWKPIMVQVGPAGFDEKSIFQDRPPVGWMLYLPFELTSRQVPEAAKILPIKDAGNGKVIGTVLVTVEETFDLENPEHIKRANAVQTRLVDQDLLPTLAEFADRY